jgi:hypothetical protein
MAAWNAVAPERVTIGRSAAGAPRTYRTLSVKHHRVREFLGGAARACGSGLNSVMVVVGDRLKLYKTGQYSADTAAEAHGAGSLHS